MAHRPWMAPGPAMHFGSQPGFSFVAQVRLNDGALVAFDSRQPAQTAGWPYRLLAEPRGASCRGNRGLLVAVRWTTRPLNALADAADELGGTSSGRRCRRRARWR